MKGAWGSVGCNGEAAQLPAAIPEVKDPSWPRASLPSHSIHHKALHPLDLPCGQLTFLASPRCSTRLQPAEKGALSSPLTPLPSSQKLSVWELLQKDQRRGSAFNQFLIFIL